MGREERRGGTATGAGRVITKRVGVRDRNPTPETAPGKCGQDPTCQRRAEKHAAQGHRVSERKPRVGAQRPGAGRGAEGTGLDPEGQPGPQKSHGKDGHGRLRGRTPGACQGRRPSACFLPPTGRGPERL